MTETQVIHLGLVNSFNLIIGNNTIDEIALSDVNLFAHNPDVEISVNLISMMIEYFQSLEMFEYCLELMTYIALNFNDDGTPTLSQCNCEYPVITKYSRKMICGSCKNRLRK